MTKDDALRMMLGPFKAWRDVPGNEDVAEELTKIINAVEKVLAQPEQEPVRLQCVTCGTVYADGVPPQVTQRTEKKMVMWPCLIDTADFSKGTVTVVMQCEDYKVSAGTHWLSTTPPKENT